MRRKLAEISERQVILPLSQPDSPLASDACFVAPNDVARVGHFVIYGGMIYVGRKLSSALGRGTEPALIDPRLSYEPGSESLAQMLTDVTDGPLSYQTLTPSERWALLNWLAEGRCSRRCARRSVRVYLMGLERRCLWDWRESKKAQNELISLFQELVRLAKLFRCDDGLFAEITALIDAIMLSHSGSYELAVELQQRRSMSLRLAAKLGSLAFACAKLPVDDALDWMMEDNSFANHPTRRRLVGSYGKIFRRNFALYAKEAMHYDMTSHEGTVLTYCPLNRGLGTQIELMGEGIAAFRNQEITLRALSSLNDACVRDALLYHEEFEQFEALCVIAQVAWALASTSSREFVLLTMSFASSVVALSQLSRTQLERFIESLVLCPSERLERRLVAQALLVLPRTARRSVGRYWADALALRGSRAEALLTELLHVGKELAIEMSDAERRLRGRLREPSKQPLDEYDVLSDGPSADYGESETGWLLSEDALPQNTLDAGCVAFAQSVKEQQVWSLGELESLALVHHVVLDDALRRIDAFTWRTSGKRAFEGIHPVTVSEVFLTLWR